MAISIDRLDGAVKIPHTNTLNFIPMTIASWVKTEHSSLPGAVGIVDKTVKNTTSGYFMFLLGGHLRAIYWQDASNCIWAGNWDVYEGFDAGFVADGHWHHLAFTVDVTGGRLYVDGRLRSSRAWTGTAGTTTDSTPLRFGHHDGEFSLGGLMREATLWNRALTESELQALMQTKPTGRESGLVGYWPFDEGSGAIAHDRSGHGHDGTLENGPVWVRPDAQ